MRIRVKLLSTYLSLILIFLSFLAFTFYIRNVLIRADSNLLAMYKLKNTWNEMLVSMDNILTNWDDGKSYRAFSVKNTKLSKEIIKFYKYAQNGAVYNNTIKNHLTGLYRVWLMAQESLVRLKENLEDPQFKNEIRKIQKIPGLQNLNHYWMEQFYKTTGVNPSSTYAVKRIIDAIEFFPIYSTTLNRQFDILIHDTNAVYTRINRLQNIVSIAFFTLFIVVVLLYSFIISRRISKPVIDSIYRLAHFMGSSIKKIELTRKDELLLLDEEINTLIAHYTHLSNLTRQLADGDINRPIEPLTDKEVVGLALKEVADYLHEFVTVSRWIQEGKYGSTIHEKTDKDILAKNFNTMSRVINEKITTLRNVFESIEEAVLVLDKNLKHVETNTNFVKLLKLKSIGQLKDNHSLVRYIPDAEDIVFKCLAGKRISNMFSEVINAKGTRIPVRINAETMPEEPGQCRQVMLFIANESYKVRAKREKEKLKAQATLSELKLLRAQINPHFLFNTLNTIAHLVETDPENAVETVEKLSDLFRYTLVATKRDFVQISEEISYIKQLLEIEHLRYGSRLSVSYTLGDGIMKQKVPPMLMQPLIENAVKYGGDEDGRIDLNISINMKKNDIVFRISDRGTGIKDLAGLNAAIGTGISNVNQRIKTLYKRELIFRKNTPKGIIAEFSLPVEGT
ncbi:MAG: PAS domain-containing protein [Spirochaetes bacterium]|nr:PAS domain-containing protein [Spirochaetota bacterium]